MIFKIFLATTNWSIHEINLWEENLSLEDSDPKPRIQAKKWSALKLS